MRVAVVNLKGGVGKTITSVHLASGLAERGRVLLVDADPYSSSSRWAERVGDRFPCDVAELSGRDLHWQLPAMAKGFDHVVIDTPPNDEAVARSAMLAAEVVVVPVGPSPMDMDRLTDTLELVGEVQEMIHHPLQLRVLLTRVRSGTRSSRVVREELASREVPVFVAEVPLREAYARAFGSPPAPQVDYSEVLTELVS
jgi:chromosome partitioning protein